MNRFALLLDRTAVLFLGIAAGVAIGLAFGRGGSNKEAVVLAPAAVPVGSAPAAIAPPPPAGPVAAPLAAVPAVRVPDAPPQIDPLTATPAAGQPIRVGVFGDSFGDGVWSALYRLLPARDGYQVVKYSQPSTGFTRYRRLNLEENDEARIAAAPIDVAVIAFGANDAQGVCGEGKCGALMSAWWQHIIGDRVASYVAMLRRHGATVYWIGLPAMRDAAFDGDAVAMNAFYAEQMAALGVPFIDIRALTIDGQGRYEDYYDAGGGNRKLLRANDGIHMSMNGYLHVAKGLAGRIRASIAAAKAAAPAESPATDTDVRS